MPAQVEYRLGSIFDEPCDLLVIPSSTGGTVTPEMQREIREARLPFPGAMTRGSVMLFITDNPSVPRVAYAAAVQGQTSSDNVVEEIGRELGRLAGKHGLRKIAAPLLGAGSGDMADAVAAAAFARGFMTTAPADAVTVVSIRDADRLRAMAEVSPSAVGRHIRHPGATPRDPDVANLLVRWARKQRAAQEAAPQAPPKTAPRATVAAEPEPRAEAAPKASTPVPATEGSGRTGVFISYSHADAEWLERLQKHLKPLQREGIDVWDDTRLKPGEPWREEIRQALAGTKVAILLISADFLASDFIVTDELPPLLKAAVEDGATILPVIISASSFLRTPSLSRFQAVNDPEKPLVQLRRGNREKVLDQVARAVEDALKA